MVEPVTRLLPSNQLVSLEMCPFGQFARPADRTGGSPERAANWHCKPSPEILQRIMRIAVVFDTPYCGWDHVQHERQMELEGAAGEADEPEMEYQIAHALRDGGHDVRLLGVRDDLEYLIRELGAWQPELVFNGAEAFRGDESLEYL